MDDKELMICLMKRCLELEKEIEKQKLSGEATITASPVRNLSTCMIPITRNRKRIKARNTKPWSG